MKNKTYDRLDYVEMKKPHACGDNNWQIIRMGMDIKIQCQGCKHIVTMLRRDFEKRIKKITINEVNLNKEEV